MFPRTAIVSRFSRPFFGVLAAIAAVLFVAGLCIATLPGKPAAVASAAAPSSTPPR